ncbi:hypothetical protein V3H18_13780 [Methylocystis sp. 9N]|uniref:DUF3325 domain-containing protein n=1 Tax=Methylocystis borbori TaxID=3118750 RepID=A0ABU7XJQ8_9HYPH
MTLSPATFQLAAFVAIATGAASLYLGAPHQRWRSRPLPALPSRIGGMALIVLGGWLWGRTLQLSTAIFATLTLSMVLLILFPCLGALPILLRRRK